MRNILRFLVTCVAIGLALSAPIEASAQTVSVPLCTADSPDCIIANWGQVDPQIESNALVTGGATSASASGRISMRPMPVAHTTDAKTKAPAVKAVTSPANFLPRETAALVAAIKRARFAKDGTIVSGDKAIAAAAETITAKAGKKYALTLYVKSAAGLKPDAAQALTQRVEAVNGLLTGAPAKGAPRS